jgi:hypothetical protein
MVVKKPWLKLSQFLKTKQNFPLLVLITTYFIAVIATLKFNKKFKKRKERKKK